jgi:glycosyltransferase involved in cell wall biosynthesis
VLARIIAAVKAKLSVIIPCKNERLNLPPCIESVRGLADEILVADSGSTDGTLEIVREIGGCRVIEREYVHSGDFKNWAIPQAAHAWVFILDADERLTEALAREIGRVLENPDRDGYWVRRANYFMGHRIRYSGWQTDRVLRLFRRDFGRYVGENDHAEVVVSTGQVGRLRQPLTHFTYWTYDHFFAKFHRYTTYQAACWHRAGRRASFLKLLLSGPLRFLHAYFVRLGFLDGLAGLQVCALTGFYSFMKQARLWELHHSLPQPDPEQENGSAAASAPSPTENKRAGGEKNAA